MMSLCSPQDTTRYFTLVAAPFNELPHFYVVHFEAELHCHFYLLIYGFYFYGTMKLKALWSPLRSASLIAVP